MSIRPAQAKGPYVGWELGSGLATYGSTYIRESEFYLGIHTHQVKPLSPPGFLGEKWDYVAGEEAAGGGADSPELRATVIPPFLYNGGPLKIRWWTFFPTAARSVFGLTPVPERIDISSYAWWIDSPMSMSTPFFGVAPTVSTTTHVTTFSLRRHADVALVPDPASGVWADGKLLYLWTGTSTPTRPNEIGILAAEILWHL